MLRLLVMVASIANCAGGLASAQFAAGSRFGLSSQFELAVGLPARSPRRSQCRRPLARSKASAPHDRPAPAPAA
jgi:hypothetical protein